MVGKERKKKKKWGENEIEGGEKFGNKDEKKESQKKKEK